MMYEDYDDYIKHREWLNHDDIDPLEDEKYDEWKENQ